MLKMTNRLAILLLCGSAAVASGVVSSATSARSVPGDDELMFRRFRGADEVSSDNSGHGGGGSSSGSGSSGGSSNGGSSSGSGNSGSGNSSGNSGDSSGKDNSDDDDRFKK